MSNPFACHSIQNNKCLSSVGHGGSKLFNLMTRYTFTSYENTPLFTFYFTYFVITYSCVTYTLTETFINFPESFHSEVIYTSVFVKISIINLVSQHGACPCCGPAPNTVPVLGIIRWALCKTCVRELSGSQEWTLFTNVGVTHTLISIMAIATPMYFLNAANDF